LSYIKNETQGKKHESLVEKIFGLFQSLISLYKEGDAYISILDDIGFGSLFDQFVTEPIDINDTFEYASNLLRYDEMTQSMNYFNEKYAKILPEISLKAINFDTKLFTSKQIENLMQIFIKTNIINFKIKTIPQKVFLFLN
jgi:hypothetical protein